MMALSDEDQARIFKRNLEKDDCAVIAIQTLLDCSRDEAMDLAVEHGFRGGGITGMFGDDVRAAIAAGSGRRMIQEEVAHNETVATFAASHPTGRYTIHSEGHVQPLVDGDLFNADGSWGAPVLQAYRLED